MFAALFAPAHAATIQAFATEVKATSGSSFSATVGSTTALSDAEIQAIIASDARAAIFGTSPTDYSVIDLGFGDTTVKTGSGGDTFGADLVVVSLWNGYNYSFGLEAFDTAGNSLSLYQYFVTDETPNSCDSTEACVKTTSINLFSNDDTAPEALGDNIEIGYISLLIGGSTFNGADGYSNFSLVGAYHTDAVVVPLPLPAILFSSGLLLLGWVGRRKAV